MSSMFYITNDPTNIINKVTIINNGEYMEIIKCEFYNPLYPYIGY